MTIGERIAFRRESLELKQYQVAELIGVTRATMCKYEKDINIPNADIIAKLAIALNTTADYLCGCTDDTNPYNDDWVHLDGDDKAIMDLVLTLTRDNKLRLSERAIVLLEEQKIKPTGN